MKHIQRFKVVWKYFMQNLPKVYTRLCCCINNISIPPTLLYIFIPQSLMSSSAAGKAINSVRMHSLFI